MAKQSSKSVAINRFEAGMSLDVDELLQKTNTMAYALNIRFIARDNTVYVITNIKGNIDESAISDNYIPIGVKSKNGIAYLICAKIINGVATGSGQIGTFPSPNYSTGDIIQEYRPLQNYSGDVPSDPKVYADFTSELFNFSLRYDLDIELQNSYDGSVNIVFTDGESPMKIINTGFIVLPNRKYTEVEQIGVNDTNKYDLEHWSTTINLVQISKKIVNLKFEGLDPGGNLKGGNYSYFFRYATQDENETDVIESSRIVSVFHGDNPSNIKGAVGDGEIVSKTVKFSLTNIDDSYAYIVPYFIWVSGKEAPIIQAVRIDTLIPISGNSILFTHSGFEQITIIDEAEISINGGSIETARTIKQFQGRLFAGNIQTKNTHDELFLDFSKDIKIGNKEVKLNTPDFNDIPTMISSINDQNLVYGEGWNNGYYNPKNIYERLSYMGGETIPFRIVFILPDGSSSKAYPMTGIDNKNNLDVDALYSAITSDVKNDMEINNGYYHGSGTLENTMVNTNGIFRFPNRDDSTNKMFDKSGKNITINGVTFTIPVIDQNIKDISIGCYFVRAENIKDVITQGVLFNTVAVPDFDFWKTTDWDSMENYNNGIYNDNNSKSIPVYDYMMEYAFKFTVKNAFGDDWLGDNKVRDSDDEAVIKGLSIEKFIQKAANPENFVTLYNKKKFAFLSNDIWSKKESFISEINGKSITFNTIYRVNSLYDIETQGADHVVKVKTVSRDGGLFSLIRPDSLTVEKFKKDADLSWVIGGSKAKNADAFSGASLFSSNPGELTDPGSTSVKRNLINYADIKYNDYLGVYLKNDELFISSGHPSWEDNPIDTITVSDIYSTTKDSMIYINIYGEGGQRTQSSIEGVYGNADNLIYRPITKKMYWDDTIKDVDLTNTLEGELDENRKIIAFGGDTYVGSSFRKIFFNAKHIDDFNIDDDLTAVTNNGYTIQFFQESMYNPALRNESIVDISEESNRTFKPYEIEEFIYDSSVKDGSDNPWRNDSRILETSEYNKGYADANVRYNTVGLFQNAPFLRESWLARVWYSGKHIPNSFQNSYRIWGGTAYQDYDTSLGEIIGLIVFNNALYVIQENGIGVLSVNERVETGSDSSGAIFIESNSVLSSYIGQISSTIGSRFKASLISTENGLYGYDGELTIIWKIGRDGLNNTTDLNIGSYLLKHGTNWRNGTTNIYIKNVRGFYDSKNKEVVFAFIDGSDSFTIGYFEPLGIFTSFYSYIPDLMFNVFDEMYSFKNARIWKHDDESIDRVSFYGGDWNFEIHFIINDNVVGTKVYENLELISNNEKPDRIIYKVQGAKATQLIAYDPANIHLSNAVYRDEKVLIPVPVVDEVTDESSSGYYPSSKDNALSLLQNTAKMRGKTMRVELIYNTRKQLRLQSVITLYRRSFS